LAGNKFQTTNPASGGLFTAFRAASTPSHRKRIRTAARAADFFRFFLFRFLRELVEQAVEYGEATAQDADGCTVTAVRQDGEKS